MFERNLKGITYGSSTNVHIGQSRTTAGKTANHKNRLAEQVRKVDGCQLCAVAQGLPGREIAHHAWNAHELPYYTFLYHTATSREDAQSVLQKFSQLRCAKKKQQWLRFIIQGGRDTLSRNLAFCIKTGAAQRLVNFTNEFGETALIQAASRGSLEIVKALLGIPGIDVNLRDHCGNTALHCAARCGEASAEAIMHLLSRHPGIENSTGAAPSPATMPGNSVIAAASSGSKRLQSEPAAQPSVIGGQIRGDAILACNTKSTASIWHDAQAHLSGGGTEAVQGLAADRAACASHGDQIGVPLYMSERRKQWIRDVIPGNLAALNCFINNGVDPDTVNAQDPFGRSALMCAILQGRLENVGKLLTIAQIDLNQMSLFGETALSLAVMMRNEKLVQMLLACPGIDPNCGAPLVVAAYNNFADMTSSLLQDHRVDVNATNWMGRTPIDIAVFMRHHRIVQRLLRAPGVRSGMARV